MEIYRAIKAFDFVGISFVLRNAPAPQPPATVGVAIVAKQVASLAPKSQRRDVNRWRGACCRERTPLPKVDQTKGVNVCCSALNLPALCRE